MRSESVTIPARRVVLRPPARGLGHAAEALEAFARWLFENAGATRVEGRTDPRNRAMQRVFHRLGWVQDGRVVDGGREWLLFTAPEYSSFRPRVRHLRG